MVLGTAAALVALQLITQDFPVDEYVEPVGQDVQLLEVALKRGFGSVQFLQAPLMKQGADTGQRTSLGWGDVKLPMTLLAEGFVAFGV